MGIVENSKNVEHDRPNPLNIINGTTYTDIEGVISGLSRMIHSM